MFGCPVYSELSIYPKVAAKVVPSHIIYVNIYTSKYFYKVTQICRLSKSIDAPTNEWWSLRKDLLTELLYKYISNIIHIHCVHSVGCNKSTYKLSLKFKCFSLLQYLFILSIPLAPAKGKNCDPPLTQSFPVREILCLSFA